MSSFQILADELAALQSMPDSARLTTEEAAKALALMGAPYTPKTLTKMRYTTSTGPRPVKVGHFVSYELGALRRFAGLDSTVSHAAR